ncbi:MAG: alanine:cation symporter family protein, partial [Cytophagales bacterium]|nr:alanine:cation symporter family protein [Cytophagales bacterium]
DCLHQGSITQTTQDKSMHTKHLSTALASTVGMGNIAGVAAAISIGGPGALFWMWVAAFVGMSTNFFTSTLSVMYRGKDSEGTIQGGPDVCDP